MASGYEDTVVEFENDKVEVEQSLNKDISRDELLEKQPCPLSPEIEAYNSFKKQYLTSVALHSQKLSFTSVLKNQEAVPSDNSSKSSMSLEAMSQLSMAIDTRKYRTHMSIPDI